MSDSPSIEVSVTVAAPPERVWSLVSDITRVSQWGGECISAQWEGNTTGPKVGARFRGLQRCQDEKWETSSVITAAEPNASFEWAVGDSANPSSTWQYKLASDG